MIKHATIGNILGWNGWDITYIDVLLTWAIDKLGVELGDIETHMYEKHLDKTDANDWIRGTMHEIQMRVVDELGSTHEALLADFAEDQNLLPGEQVALKSFIIYNLYIIGNNNKYTINGSISYFNNMLDDCTGNSASDCMIHMMYQGLMIIRNEY